MVNIKILRNNSQYPIYYSIRSYAYMKCKVHFSRSCKNLDLMQVQFIAYVLGWTQSTETGENTSEQKEEDEAEMQIERSSIFTEFSRPHSHFSLSPALYERVFNATMLLSELCGRYNCLISILCDHKLKQFSVYRISGHIFCIIIHDLLDAIYVYRYRFSQGIGFVFLWSCGGNLMQKINSIVNLEMTCYVFNHANIEH